MPGTRITDQQARLYMSYRKHHPQELAAAKAGMSARAARRIERRGNTLPSQDPRRYWRSRPDPFAEVWEAEIVPRSKNAPQLMAITLLRKLQEAHPEGFPDGVLRTLQRRIRQWRALEGPIRSSGERRRSRSDPLASSPSSTVSASRMSPGEMPFQLQPRQCRRYELGAANKRRHQR